MGKEFIPYEEALVLKELGFDEPCLAGWSHPFEHNPEGYLNFDQEGEYDFRAPLYQQAFRWLYQKLSIENGIMPLDTESQQLLLKELIDKLSLEIIKKKIIMGKMKEVFMEMIEHESFNIPEEYSFYKTEVLCPNCNKSNLIQISKNDYACDKCAQNFILVENSLKFK